MNYDKYSEVKDLIKWLYAGSDETYGYRRIQDELFLFGYVDDETVRRIMRSSFHLTKESTEKSLRT
ncbi:IS3 family transposase [Periweissella cryptocerci]|uniref:IS3 family transposase n=1 Tax=Periweissella cryptocerci TaxID=2506420 RepID=UPI001404636E